MSPLAANPRLSLPGGISVRLYGRVRRVWRLAVLAAAACASPGIQAGPAGTSVPVGGAVDYSRIESQVFAALNRARTDPRSTAASLEALLPYFTGTRFRRPTWPVAVQTVEGPAAVREAVAALRAQPAVPALVLDPILTRAARDHAADQAGTGQTGHTGSDGSTVVSRVARYGSWEISINENIDYQPMRDGREVIESLLIDDGVRDRAHRRNIYEPSSRRVGIACGPHPRFGAMCVIVEAGGVRPK